MKYYLNNKYITKNHYDNEIKNSDEATQINGFTFGIFGSEVYNIARKYQKNI